MCTPQSAANTCTEILAGRLVHLDRILVATDFSPASNLALDYAVSLAKRYGSHIYVVHVISGDAYPLTAPEVTINMLEQQRLQAQYAAEKLAASSRLQNVPHDLMIAEGPLWASLKEVIGNHKIDLVVVGTHGAGAFHKVLLGSGAEQIFRQANVPVLTVGPGAEPAKAEAGFQSILFASDFGLGAEREAAFAFSLAQEHEATITLLHVVQHSENYSAAGLERWQEAARGQLRQLVPKGVESWCRPEFRVSFGGSVEEILRIAAETKADLIVMGAKARGGFVGHNPRTIAYRVVCAAKCPVLTVRSR